MIRAVRSGWAGAGGSWGLREWHRPCGIRDGGPPGDGNGTEAGAVTGTATETGAASGGIGRTPLALVLDHERGETAAVQGESEAQFFPRRRIHLTGHDAEIEADVDEDGADRAAAVVGEGFLGRGCAGEGRIPRRPGRRG